MGEQQVAEFLGGALPVVPRVAEEQIAAIRVRPGYNLGFTGKRTEGSSLGGAV